ncbi:lamin tail domain-containing protein [Halorussus halophilus]|uniref:lamin tail domain-containing protein n=1 Tax=Halorussus halophilus TaxID=2650975 RepID=UPI001300E2FB|nr:lamin tail domain-containing protein [Halorussus halophilus]
MSSSADAVLSHTSLAALSVALLLVFAGCLGASGPTETTGGDTGTGDATVGSLADDGTLSVHFIHVGQGTSILVVGPSGETLLYDTGNWDDDGEYVLDYLREHDISRIDYLVTSHADADHIGGHAAVIDYYETQADGVGAIYDPGIAASTDTYDRYLDAVEEHNVTLYQSRAGDVIPMEGASVRVLSPPKGYLDRKDRNENSLVLRVGYENASVLLPGDVERDGEGYLQDSQQKRLDSTLLSAGHHGSNSSSSPGFLAATTPRVVAIQSAYDSPYGHPHDEVLERLAERQIPTYWTGVHGDVVFETDGDRVVVKTQRAAPTDPAKIRSVSGVSPGADDPLEERGRFRIGGGQSLSGTASGETVATDGGTTGAKADATLSLAEAHPDAAGEEQSNLNDEYVVLRNDGQESLDLSGWTVSDEADHEYTFPQGTTLKPGETLTLHTGTGEDAPPDYYWNADSPVWNNDGDTVFVHTAEGTLVLEEQYDG